MRIITLSLASVAILSLAAFTGNKNLVVTSTAFANNGMIPIKYSCLGQEASPPLNVTNVPAGTKSLAMIVEDPDAPIMPAAPAPRVAVKGDKKHKTKKPASTKVTKVVSTAPTESKGCFTHWIIWNMETNGQIAENFKNDFEGMNGLMQSGYKGMCPPSGTHHYHFKVYALDAKLNIPKTSDKAALEKVMQGHILAWGELVGIFNKTYN